MKDLKRAKMIRKVLDSDCDVQLETVKTLVALGVIPQETFDHVIMASLNSYLGDLQMLEGIYRYVNESFALQVFAKHATSQEKLIKITYHTTHFIITSETLGGTIYDMRVTPTYRGIEYSNYDRRRCKKQVTFNSYENIKVFYNV